MFIAVLAVSENLAAQESPNEPAAPHDASAAAQTFDVWEIRVLGNTVLPQREVEKVLYPFLGADRAIADIEKARLALETRYKDAGYGTVYVDIPEQEVKSGVVRLRVTEGRLDRVRVTGARYYSNRAICAEIPALSEGKVLNLNDVQKELTAVNRQAPRDRTVVPILKAGRTPGTVDAELKVKDSLPVHGGVEFNNRYTADTSHNRLSANLSFDNLWQRYHSIALQYQTAPGKPREADVIAGTYVAPLQSNGNIFAVYAVHTDSEFTTLGPQFNSLGVVGKGSIYGLRYIVPLQSTPTQVDNMAFGADYKDFRENIVQSDGSVATTPISYINWSVDYSATRPGEGRLTTFDIAVDFGVRGLANSSEEFAFKRYSGQPNKGDPNYFYLRGSARHQQRLFGDFSAAIKLTGQYTWQALISNEQFAIGGADSVRGYLESESLGDYGAAGSVELRWALPQSWLGDEHSVSTLLFYDDGFTRIHYPLPEQVDLVQLSSWGAGAEFAGFGGFSANFAWAYPLRDGDHVAKGDTRWHFQVKYDF